MPKTTGEHIHTHSVHVRRGLTNYVVHVHGAQRDDGTWEGWLEFHPVNGKGSVLRTGQETSQPTRITLDYWAGGLERVYLEGALERAHE